MKKEEKNPLCSLVILSYNQVDFTKMCLESIRKYTDIPYEIIIVDNNSSEEGCIEFLKEQKDIVLIQNKENKGFAGGCNQGIKVSKGKYIMLLNNDTIVTKKWLSNMVDLLENNQEIAMTGPLTNATVGKQKIIVNYEDDLDKMHIFAEEIANSDAKPWRTLRLVFFCVLIRKELFQELGLLDEGFIIGNYEDDDFNIRVLSANKKMYICRNSFVHHFMNVSFKNPNIQREKIMQKNKIHLEEKWNKLDWNHHAVFNSYMLEQILTHNGNKILHIGCGLGALEIELNDNREDYYIVGIELHRQRRKVAETFLNKVYELDQKFQFIEKLPKEKFDVIIIENSLEVLGLGLLEKIKPFINKTTLILIRVFNCRHITAIEKTVMGNIEGELLCAVSPEFDYQFDSSIMNNLIDLGYLPEEIKEVKKSLSTLQKQLLEQLKNFNHFSDEAMVYNRIYKLHYNKIE